MIAIVDYEIGNLAAILNMMRRLGTTCEITADPQRIAKAGTLVLPGNGTFDACMQGLRSTGLVPLLHDGIMRQRTPPLGICVSAQMLGRGSEEGSATGFGWTDIEVKRFPALPQLRVPHMGWCHVRRTETPNVLIDRLAQDAVSLHPQLLHGTGRSARRVADCRVRVRVCRSGGQRAHCRGAVPPAEER